MKPKQVVSKLPDCVTLMLLDKDDSPSAVVTSHKKIFEREWRILEPATKIGRVVIMADMEGISAVPNDEAAVTAYSHQPCRPLAFQTCRVFAFQTCH